MTIALQGRGAAPRPARVFVALLFLAALGVVPVIAAPGDVGYEGSSYTGTTAPTREKPESKLWYNAAGWWGSLFDPATSSHWIYRLNTATQTWVKTSVPLDNRPSSKADVLWDDASQKLYVASHVFSSTGQAASEAESSRLYRFSYNSANASYSLDSGFPVLINRAKSEALVIDIDSQGRLWATWVQGGRVYLSHTTCTTTCDDRAWVTPFIPAVDGVNPSSTFVDSDDLSAVISFGDKVGLMWSNQKDSAIYFAEHSDSAAPGTWQASRTALQGPNMSDDHINLARLMAADGGRVYAVTKTGHSSSSAPLVMVLARNPSNGSWTSYRHSTRLYNQTRPIALIDETAQRLHIFASDTGGGAIYHKSTPLSNIAFEDGKGTPVMLDQDAPNLNDATSTKQAVNVVSGMVVLASNETTKRYWHYYDPLGGSLPPTPSPTPTPTAAPTATPTGAPTATPTGAPTATPTGAPTATPTGAPVGGQITLRAASSGANQTATLLTLPRPNGVQAGDVLLASVDVRSTPTLTAPAGWQLVRLDDNATTMRKATYVRIAGSSEPATYTWQLSSAQAGAGVVLAYSGVDTAAPISAATGLATTSNSKLIVAPSATVNHPNSMAVGLFAMTIDVDISPPAGMTEQAEAGTPATKYKVTSQASDTLWPSTGATGNMIATGAKAARNTGQLVILKPAAVSGPTTTPTSAPTATLTAAPTATLTAAPTATPTSAPTATPTSAPTNAPGGGQIMLRGASSGVNTTDITVTISRPAGVQAGDLLLASIDVRGRPTVTPPSGWQLVRSDDNLTTMRKATFFRIAGASEPASYSWQLSVAQAAAGVILAYSGVDPANPVSAHSGLATTTASKVITAPSVTVVDPNSMLVGLFDSAGYTDITSPPGMTERAEAGTPATTYRVTSHGSDRAWTNAGPTGDMLASSATAFRNIGQLVVLRPAP